MVYAVIIWFTNRLLDLCEEQNVRETEEKKSSSERSMLDCVIIKNARNRDKLHAANETTKTENKEMMECEVSTCQTGKRKGERE